MQDKNKVLNIVRNQNDPQKEKKPSEIWQRIYDALEDNVLPKLRKATITLRAYRTKKTDEEIATLALDNPAELDNKELLYAAELTDISKQKWPFILQQVHSFQTITEDLTTLPRFILVITI